MHNDAISGRMAAALEALRELGELVRFPGGRWAPEGSPTCSCCGTVHNGIPTCTLYALERRGLVELELELEPFEGFPVSSRARLVV